MFILKDKEEQTILRDWKLLLVLYFPPHFLVKQKKKKKKDIKHNDKENG